MARTKRIPLSEAAKRLGVTSANLRQARLNGRIEAEWVITEPWGGAWMVTEAEVERYRSTHLGQKGWAKRKGYGAVER